MSVKFSYLNVIYLYEEAVYYERLTRSVVLLVVVLKYVCRKYLNYKVKNAGLWVYSDETDIIKSCIIPISLNLIYL